MKPKILSVRIERKIDESSDLSWLGAFTNKQMGIRVNRLTGELLAANGYRLANNLPANGDSRSLNFIGGFQWGQGLVANWEHVSDKELWTQFAEASEQMGRFNIAGCEHTNTRREKILCLEYLHICQDALRLESYKSGDWQMLGIIAKAEIQLTPESPIQTIRSGGLWGVESDSSHEYMTEVQDEQLSELAVELATLGFSVRQVRHAIKSVKRD